MPKLRLIQYPGIRRTHTMSAPCGKAHMTLRFKGLEFDIHNCNSPAQVKKFNPRGRVPALIIDGETIVDSSDIISAIDQRFPDPPLLPSDPVACARIKLLEDWADEVLYFYGVYTRWLVPENYQRMYDHVLARLPIPLKWIVPTIAVRQVTQRLRGQGVGLKGADTVRRELDECLDALEQLCGLEPYLVGNQLSRADIAVAAIVDQFRLEPITPELAADIDQRSNIRAWLDRVHESIPCAAG